jgi:hypothetical protein
MLYHVLSQMLKEYEQLVAKDGGSMSWLAANAKVLNVWDVWDV